MTVSCELHPSVTMFIC